MNERHGSWVVWQRNQRNIVTNEIKNIVLSGAVDCQWHGFYFRINQNDAQQ